MSDAARVLKASQEIWPPGPTFLTDAARVVLEVVGADVVTFNRVDFRSGVREMSIAPEEWKEPLEALRPVVEKLAYQHPIIDHFMDSSNVGAMRISERVSADVWRRSELYQAYYKPLGLHWQMVMAVPSGDQYFNVVALSRSDRDFDERDVAVCEALLPILALGCGGAPDEPDLRVNTAAGWHIFAIDHARRVLRAAPDDPAGVLVPGLVLPNGLVERTAKAQLGELQRCLLEDGEWLVRKLGGTEERSVMLAKRERDAPVALSALTLRQRDVLCLVAEGRKNAAIAYELGIAEGTVRKHVENALVALQVPNRAAAAAIWREGHGA